VSQLTFVGQCTQPDRTLGKSLARDVLEVLVDRKPCRDLEPREVVLTSGNLDVHPLGDPHRIGERFRVVLEDPGHLLGALQVELVAVIAQALLVVNGFAGADAQQDVVRLVIVLLQIVHIVGAHQRQAEVASNRHQARVDHALFVQSLKLHFKEEVAIAEDVAIRGGGGHRAPALLAANFRCHFTFQAAAETDQALAVRREQVFVDARLVVEAVGIAGRHELDEVLESLAGLGQQHEMVGRFADGAALVESAARSDVHLASQNRLDAALSRGVMKHDRRKHVAVFRHRQRRHVQPRRLVEQLVDSACAVEQRVLGVEVEVDEVAHRTETVSSKFKVQT
jgi:hypothetical protein